MELRSTPYLTHPRHDASQALTAALWVWRRPRAWKPLYGAPVRLLACLNESPTLPSWLPLHSPCQEVS